MGKMMYALALIFAIEVGLLFFPSGTTADTSLMDTILNPSLWTTSDFGFLIMGAIAAIGAMAGGAALVGHQLSSYDWLWRASLAVVLVTFVGVIGQLYTYINSNMAMFLIEFGGMLPPDTLLVSKYMTALVIAPIMIFFIFTVIEFISGKD